MCQNTRLHNHMRDSAQEIITNSIQLTKAIEHARTSKNKICAVTQDSYFMELYDTLNQSFEDENTAFIKCRCHIDKKRCSCIYLLIKKLCKKIMGDKYLCPSNNTQIVKLANSLKLIGKMIIVEIEKDFYIATAKNNNKYLKHTNFLNILFILRPK